MTTLEWIRIFHQRKVLSKTSIFRDTCFVSAYLVYFHQNRVPKAIRTKTHLSRADSLFFNEFQRRWRYHIVEDSVKRNLEKKVLRNFYTFWRIFDLSLWWKWTGNLITEVNVQSVIIKKKRKPSLLISKQFIVKKWNLYQSTWISVYFHFMLLKFSKGPSTWGLCLALNFSLEISLHGGLYLTLIFFNANLRIWQRNRKVHRSNCLDTNFHIIFDISLRVIRRRNYN